MRKSAETTRVGVRYREQGRMSASPRIRSPNMPSQVPSLRSEIVR